VHLRDLIGLTVRINRTVYFFSSAPRAGASGDAEAAAIGTAVDGILQGTQSEECARYFLHHVWLKAVTALLKRQYVDLLRYLICARFDHPCSRRCG